MQGCCKVKALEKVPNYPTERKERSEEEFEPARCPKERERYLKNVQSTASNTEANMVYRLINLSLDSFMMDVNVGVPRPACDGFCH